MREGLKTSLRYWIPTILWLGIIFVLSTDFFSEQNTGTLLAYLLARFYHPLGAQEFWFVHHIVRKLAHMSEYAILSIFCYRSLQQGDPRWSWKSALGAVAICAVIGFLDEGHQMFEPHRGGMEMKDVGFDTLGGIGGQIAVITYFLAWPWRTREAA